MATELKTPTEVNVLLRGRTGELPGGSHDFARFTWIALGLGVAARLGQYLLNRSLWLDEAQLTLNILHRSFSGLLQPLSEHQGAPVAWLLLEKLLVRSLGESEYALRALPLACGIASVFLFYVVAKQVLRSAEAIAIAVALVALSPSLIYYSSEVKQYSTDVAITLAIYALVLAVRPEQWGGGRLAALAAVGAAGVWLSHASVLVMAGIAVTVQGGFLARKQWTSAFRFSLPCLAWAASVAGSYLVSLSKLTRDRDLLAYWTGNFMPFPPRSVSDLKWFWDAFFSFFRQSAGMEFAGLMALAFVVGTAFLWFSERQKLLLLLSPVAVTLAASAVHKYPFGGRLSLFLVPGALLIVGVGAEQIRLAAKSRSAVIGYAFLALLFLDPSVYLLHHFAKPHVLVAREGTMLLEEIKPAMGYVWSHEQPGDLIYVVTGAQPAYRYYDEFYGRREQNLVLGTALADNAREYVQDLNRLRGHRAWVVLSHIGGAPSPSGQAKHVLFYLDTAGTRLDHFAAAGAEVYLYDLRQTPPAEAGSAGLEERR